MDERINEHGQPIGPAVPDWRPRPFPTGVTLDGRLARVTPLDPDQHTEDLYAANGEDRDGEGWTYLPYGPFADITAYRAWMRATCQKHDPQFYAILDRETDRAQGLFALQRIDPTHGSLEIAHVRYAPALQGTAAATEAMYLILRHIFDDLGYRRCEWKCDSLNAPSRAAAQRLGFRYEGLFRQALVYRDRNRDTAWYSIIDGEWPALREKLEFWLRPENFEADGRQRHRLSALTRNPD
jgi:RimJ/RimL family protein N-acetyltransferase